eukprot:2150660-Prymnesium_polylepis.1
MLHSICYRTTTAGSQPVDPLHIVQPKSGRHGGRCVPVRTTSLGFLPARLKPVERVVHKRKGDGAVRLTRDHLQRHLSARAVARVERALEASHELG